MLRVPICTFHDEYWQMCNCLWWSYFILMLRNNIYFSSILITSENCVFLQLINFYDVHISICRQIPWFFVLKLGHLLNIALGYFSLEQLHCSIKTHDFSGIEFHLLQLMWLIILINYSNTIYISLLQSIVLITLSAR